MELDLLPDVAIAEEACNNRTSGQAITKASLTARPGGAAHYPGLRPVDPEAVRVLCEPLPADIPTVDKDLLILMAAWSGNIDRYARLRRPTRIHPTAGFENTLYIKFTAYCFTTMQFCAWWRRNIN
ncbi:hypothetical protein N7501_004582 [Penicillium viridicatum]|nr:hypothetical protein N7501_004582 [Penicillium viridicatum]